MTTKEFYQRIHGDYEDMIARIPSNKLILYFVRQFPLDNTYEKLMEAVQKEDIKASFEAAHNLKGLASSLSFSELFAAASALTNQLRPQTEPANAALIQRVSEHYHFIMQAIDCFENDRITNITWNGTAINKFSTQREAVLKGDCSQGFENNYVICDSGVCLSDSSGAYVKAHSVIGSKK